MFAWYRDAAVCFAYLSDLSPGAPFDVAFPRCRWLTRGWTLQELIAPKDVTFYDVSWNRVSSKLESRSLIARSTGIDSFVLQDSSMLSSVLVARRMSWAAKRNTTRAEDMAYCLLGIFDINMPMLYGEGGHKAFLRLQEEIAKQTVDLSLFAWRAESKLQEVRGIFATSPREFAACGTMDSSRRGTFHDNEFIITNKGLRIETTLVELLGECDDVIFNVAVSEGHSSDTADSTGWLGIFLRKTSRGYVRASPHLLHRAGDERVGRRRVPRGVVYIRKDVTPLESMRVQMQYRGAVVLGPLPDFVRIIDVQPRDLWDHRRRLFLHHGIGLNVYVHLRIGVGGKPDPKFDAIVAACTMSSATTSSSFASSRASSSDAATNKDTVMTDVSDATAVAASSDSARLRSRGYCFVWDELDPGYRRVMSFLRNAQEVADYTAADYLRRYVPDKSFGLTTATCVYTDPKTRRSASLSVTLEEGSYQRWRVYHLRIRVGGGGYS